jgi:hypothetical protein
MASLVRLHPQIDSLEMLGDHIFGLPPLLASIMNGAGGTVGIEDTRHTSQNEVRTDFCSNAKLTDCRI